MILVVTAVPAERDAVALALGPLAVTVAEVEVGTFRALRHELPCETGPGGGRGTPRVVDVVAVGVGPLAAAAGTASCLRVRRYDVVVSAGIGGTYDPAGGSRQAGGSRPPDPLAADLVVADRVALDGFGAESPDRFLSAPEIGLGDTSWDLTGDGRVADEEARDVGRLLVRQAAERTGARVGTIVTVLAATGTEATARARRDRWQAAAEGMEGAGVLVAALAAEVPFLEVRAISNVVGARDRQTWDVPGALRSLADGLRALLHEPLAAEVSQPSTPTPAPTRDVAEELS